MRRNHAILTTAALAALASPAALAQVDTSDWKCEYCPFDKGYRADLEAGISGVSDEAWRYGNGTGYDDKGAYAELGGEGRYYNDGTEATWKAEDLGLDSLDIIQFLFHVDQKTGVEIEDEVLLTGEFKSIADLAEYVDRNRSGST